MKQNVMLLIGAGQIGVAIARRMGYGMKIVIGDKKTENAQTIAKTMNDAGFDVVPVEMDLSSRASIQSIIAQAQKYGDITMLVNAAGVSPSQDVYKRQPLWSSGKFLHQSVTPPPFLGRLGTLCLEVPQRSSCPFCDSRR